MRNHHAECKVESQGVFLFVQLQGSTPEPPFSFKKTPLTQGLQRRYQVKGCETTEK